MSDAVTKAVEAAAKAIIRGRASDGDSLSQGLTGAALESYVNAHWNWWETDAQRAIAAFLDAMKDAPTEEMLRTVCGKHLYGSTTIVPLDGGPSTTETHIHHLQRQEVLAIWLSMCLALRRGVAGDTMSTDQQVKAHD